jgi:putative heme iron utilization protein
MVGFPMTAVVPLGVSYDGNLIMLLSDLAQHSKNINIDNRVSLLLHDDQEHNWQAAHRLTVLGYLKPLRHQHYDMDRLRHDYYSLHPELNEFESHPDFGFWQLHPLRFRMIAGFAQVRWLTHIESDLLMVDETDRQHITQQLAQRRMPTRLLFVSRYGVQILEAGRVRFLSFRVPAQSIAGVIAQLSTGSYDDPSDSVSPV